MFFRQKPAGPYRYIQIVENRREGGKVRQHTLMTVGRLDQLQESGQLDALIRSGLRFCERLAALDVAAQTDADGVETKRIGPDLVFGRLWERLGIAEEIRELLRSRRYQFDLERAVYLTVLHRLMISGSDRAAEKWRRDYRIPGTEDLDLHHLYRAMAFLGEELPATDQDGRTPFVARCTKDLLEERLFARRRDLFTDLQMMFFDTTSIYFEGRGGKLGARGLSKDHRPDLMQIVVGVILDSTGTPVCCEMWPGNTTDVKSLLPVAERLRKRFGIQQACLVADRGMISKDTVAALENSEIDWRYILGARMRSTSEVRKDVLSRPGSYREVVGPRRSAKDPAPLKVKEVWVDDHRYVVCINEEQRRKDAADREAIVAHLRDQLARGEKSLVGNKGYRKFLARSGQGVFRIDERKIRVDERYDGKWVLRTNMDLSADEIALKYKQLWMVEDIFRTMKSVLDTRPIYHKRTETIRGHVFCSFLALLLRKELQDRITEKGADLEWNDLIRDLNELQEIHLDCNNKRFVLRSQLKGCCHQVLQAAGVGVPPTIRDA